MNIKYQAAGKTVYELYMIENIEKYLEEIVKVKLQNSSLKVKVISYRQLKQEKRLNYLGDITPLLNMRGRKIELNYLYLLLYSEEERGNSYRLLDCAPFSEQGLAFIFHNPGISFGSEEELFKTAAECVNATARISLHFFNSDLALSKIPSSSYRALYVPDSNSVTSIVLTTEEVATDTELIRKIAATYEAQVVSGLQQDVSGEKRAVLRITKKLS